jgi:transcriptional regulator with XRE-family HTH domain
MNQTHLNVAALYASLDAQRSARNLSWRNLAKDIGISPSTFSRMANGLRPDVDAFASMTQWLAMPADVFITDDRAGDREEPELVAQLAPLLRARSDLEDKDVEYLQELIGAAVRRFRTDRTGN